VDSPLLGSPLLTDEAVEALGRALVQPTEHLTAAEIDYFAASAFLAAQDREALTEFVVRVAFDVDPHYTGLSAAGYRTAARRIVDALLDGSWV
jgi:hypothetical protein